MFNSPEFQALRREYLSGALERCAHLEAEVSRLRQGQPVDLRTLRQEIHKFRGSGGFYGFTDLSATSGTAEDQLILILDGEAERHDPTLADLIDRVITAARSAAAEVGL